MLETENADRNENLRKLQNTELSILHYFSKICEENGIRFYMLGGTFLGAVRHGGFIPWDDDIDIGVPREDYEKLLGVLNKYKNDKYDFECFRINKEQNNYILKIVDKSIVVRDTSSIATKEQAAWIDVFPLDGMPDNKVLFSIHKYRLLAARAKVNYSAFSQNVNIKNTNRPLVEKILIWVGKHFPVEKIFNTYNEMNKLDKLLKKYSYEECSKIINFMGAYKFREMFPKKIYDETALYKFEDMQLYAPKDYDSVLAQMYGDYMKLPDEERRNHHNIEFVEK